MRLGKGRFASQAVGFLGVCVSTPPEGFPMQRQTQVQ